MDSEFAQRFSGRYFGKYRGLASRVDDDPKKLYRIMVKVPAVFGEEEELGWAFPNPSEGGGMNKGGVSLPEVGDLVWVEFEEGDPAKPIWTAGPWGMRQGRSMVPLHGQGDPDDTDYAVRDTGNMPPSQFQGGYGQSKTMQSKSGHFLEMDDTTGNERVQLSHRTGSRLEFLADGSLQSVATGSYRERSEAGWSKDVGGDDRTAIAGGRIVEVEGNVEDVFKSDYSRSAKAVSDTADSYLGNCAGSFRHSNTGPYDLNCQSRGSFSFANQLAFMVGQNLQMTVMENMEIAASNATAPPASPTNVAASIHAYNGQFSMKATDPTGLLNIAEIVLQGNAAAPNVANILLGGLLATQPFVLGTLYSALFGDIITTLANHTHPTGVGPTAVSVEIGLKAPGWSVNLPNTLSQMIMGR